MSGWTESYRYVPRATEFSVMETLPVSDLALAHKLMEKEPTLSESTSSLSLEEASLEIWRFPAVCIALSLKVPERFELIRSALDAQYFSWFATTVRATNEDPSKYREVLRRTGYWRMSAHDGFPGDCYEILGFDPDSEWTMKDLIANHGRTVIDRLDAYDISGLFDCQLLIERAWWAAVRKELPEALEHLRRAGGLLLTVDWPNEEPSSVDLENWFLWNCAEAGLPEEWFESIESVRSVIYSQISTPLTELKALPVNTSVQLQDAFLDIASLLDESIKSATQEVIDHIEGVNRRLDNLSDRIPSVAENQELRRQFERIIQRLTRRNEDELVETNKRLAVELAYWSRMSKESQKDVVTSEVLYHRYASIDDELLAPACIAIGYYRACEWEQQRSRAHAPFDRFYDLRNRASHRSEFSTSDLVEFRDLALKQVLLAFVS